MIPVRIAPLLLLATGCLVTRAPRIEERPRWRLADATAFEADCLVGRAFVRKSGKQGFGVALQLRSRRDCPLALAGVKLVLRRRTLEIPPIALAPLPGRSLVYAWLPVAFDNNEAWNDGETSATLELALVVEGQPRPWRIALVQQ